MSKVYNWQLGREMEYPYEEAHPRLAVRLRLQHQPLHRLPDLHDGLQVHLDLLNRGQEQMWWNNVETKPYGGLSTVPGTSSSSRCSRSQRRRTGLEASD